MDPTMTYFKMCDHPKIQEHSDYELGELVSRPLPGDGKAIIIVGHNNQSYLRTEGGKLKYRWLPRQGEIQKIMKCENLVELIDNFNKFYRNQTFTISKIQKQEQAAWVQEKGKKIISFNSLEQLWLAFYMYEKHGLTWNFKKEQWKPA